jgi:hypothetical protein
MNASRNRQIGFSLFDYFASLQHRSVPIFEKKKHLRPYFTTCSLDDLKRPFRLSGVYSFQRGDIPSISLSDHTLIISSLVLRYPFLSLPLFTPHSTYHGWETVLWRFVPDTRIFGVEFICSIRIFGFLFFFLRESGFGAVVCKLERDV